MVRTSGGLTGQACFCIPLSHRCALQDPALMAGAIQARRGSERAQEGEVGDLASMAPARSIALHGPLSLRARAVHGGRSARTAEVLFRGMGMAPYWLPWGRKLGWPAKWNCSGG